ncbi:hypothetical protein J3459_013676, partial [Metarhizium acridum]
GGQGEVRGWRAQSPHICLDGFISSAAPLQAWPSPPPLSKFPTLQVASVGAGSQKTGRVASQIECTIRTQYHPLQEIRIPQEDRSHRQSEIASKTVHDIKPPQPVPSSLPVSDQLHSICSTQKQKTQSLPVILQNLIIDQFGYGLRLTMILFKS